jgi:hypothetical protein
MMHATLMPGRRAGKNPLRTRAVAKVRRYSYHNYPDAGL